MNHFKLSALTAPISSKTGMTHAVLQSIYNHAESTQNDRARIGLNERGGVWYQEWVTLSGSRDWTLKREKLTAQTVSLARRFYEEALQWLVDDGYANTIEVSVWIDAPTQMGRHVIITLTDGEKFKVSL